jgi:N-methylhydantoinase A
MKLRRDLAEAAVDTIAARLGVSRHEAAYAIYTTSNHNMVAAIEEITVREGINPRDSFFVCGGGATAIHIAEMADILGLRRYMIPRFMAGLSAFGGLISDIRNEASAVFLTSDAFFNAAGVNAALGRIRQHGDRFLADAGVAPDNRQFEFSFLGRYEYQSFEIEVPFECPSGSISDADLPGLVEAFHKMHERIYSIRADNDVVEFTAWRLRAIGKRSGQDLWQRNVLAAQAGAVTPKARRGVYQQHKGRVEEVPVYDLAALGADAALQGPCLIEAETFTAYLKEQHNGTLDRYGNLVVTVV